jgi:hypothetical protein
MRRVAGSKYTFSVWSQVGRVGAVVVAADEF